MKPHQGMKECYKRITAIGRGKLEAYTPPRLREQPKAKPRRVNGRFAKKVD